AFFVFGKGEPKGEGSDRPTVPLATTAPTTVPAPIPPPAVTPPPKPTPAPVPAVAKKVLVRVTSEPVGAKVVDDAQGDTLGVTPLVLTRPRGGALKLRVEKDGYGAGTRTVLLDTDQSVGLTLEHKPKARAPPKPRESNEPAKL